VQLIAFGGDLRMNGLLRAARRAGFACDHVREKRELGALKQHADVLVLPWPRSFAGGMLFGTQIDERTLLDALPSGDLVMAGGVKAQDFPRAGQVFDPSGDEELLLLNAKLTAEGAIAALLNGGRDALMGKCCLITGFGRIAQALTQRLTAMEMFVIVCARNEGQMQLAHRVGAHPVPMRELAFAAMQADYVINTAPARLFGSEALAQMKPGVRYLELAGVPYGADPEQAAHLGVSMEIMSGLPGKYAPERAGEALFDALSRVLQRMQGESGEGN